jgi:DNA helicase-2/ATP-dependent DNA helicase PcrA
MTIHSSKGLEFPVVIVAGMNEGILPSKQAISSGDIEAERRLAYVAMTRARDQLILTVRPETTEANGRTYNSPISRFIGEAL